MTRRPTQGLTDREAEIMDVVWGLGEATADQVRGRLSGAPHDSTVRTILRLLEAKGYLGHEARDKAYVYRPLVPREAAQRRAVADLLGRFFRGSAGDLVQQLLDNEHLTPGELDRIRRAAEPSTGKRRPRRRP